MRFVHTGAAHRRRREPVTHLSLLSNGLSIKSPILGSEVIPSKKKEKSRLYIKMDKAIMISFYVFWLVLAFLESMFRPKSEVLSFKLASCIYECNALIHIF